MGRDNVYRLEKDGVRFTLFLFTNGSRPKSKHKAGVSNKEPDDVRRRANFPLIQHNEVVGVD